MRRSEHQHNSGQAMVEFAMILVLLLFIIFVLVEAARLFQANLTVQSAAREAGRYAVTGQFETDCLLESPPCTDPRVVSVQRVAEAALAGLPANPNADARLREPNAYMIQVLTPAEGGGQWIEGVGDPGAPVMIRVLYEVDIITPLLRPIANVVRVMGQVVMNNEQSNQVGGTSGDPSAPNLPPPPTVPPPPPPPDLSLTMAGPPRALTGSQYDYTLVVTNHSNELAATSVRLVNTLDLDVFFVAAPGCTLSGDTVTCDIGTLAPMANASFIITVQASDEELTVTNRAEVTLDQADEDLSNNRDELDTIFEENPIRTDVEIVKSGPEVVQGGEEFTYRLLVANISLVEATGVEVVDTLPAGVIFAGPAEPDICASSGSTVNCSVGSLPPLSDTEITLNVTAPDSVGTVTNLAEVSVVSPAEITTDNNTSSWDTDVVILPDLRVTLFDTPDPIFVGGNLTYEIIISNNGDGDATNVVMTNILPTSVNFISVTPAGNCQRAGNNISCQLGNLPSGASTTLSIVVQPAESSTIVNTAAAYSDEDDLNPADNTASSSTSVRSTADLAITKTGPAAAEQGEPYNYTLAVRNNGPSSATGVTVRDTLPSGLSISSASASQGYCDTRANPVVCSLGRMESGATATITLRVTPLNVGAMRNVASVSGGENDPVSRNNSSNVTTVVEAGNYFMTAAPLCGEVGTPVTLNGYNWRANSVVNLEWNGAPFGPVTANSSGGWGTTYTIPGPLADGVYNFVASQPGRTFSVPFTIPCPAPNLIVSQPAFVGSPPSSAGQPTTVRVTIQNIGNLDAVSQFFVGLYINPSPEPVAASTHLPAEQRAQIVAVNGLERGQTKIIDFVLESGLNSGTNRLFVVVDSDPGPVGSIQERTETDNISTPLHVSIAGSSGPTPTPTPAPISPGSIAGRVRNEAGNPQANVEIWLYDESDNSLESRAFSDFNGSYFFASVEADRYTMIACIRIEDVTNPGVFLNYWASVPGVIVAGGQTTTQNLFLQLAPQGCIRP